MSDLSFLRRFYCTEAAKSFISPAVVIPDVGLLGERESLKHAREEPTACDDKEPNDG